MKSAILLLVLSPLATAARAEAQRPEGPEKSTAAVEALDQRMDEIDRMIDDLARVRAPSPWLFASRDDIDMRKIESFECRALISSRIDECEGLRPGAKPHVSFFQTGGAPAESDDRVCIVEYRYARWFAALLVGAPSYADDCLIALRKDAPPTDALNAKIARGCSMMAAGYTDPKGLCARLTAAAAAEGRAFATVVCERQFRSVLGDKTVCPLKDDPGRSLCYSLAYFHSAFFKKNIEKCGTSGVCRALMGGGPSSCEVYASEKYPSFNDVRGRMIGVDERLKDYDLQSRPIARRQRRLAAQRRRLAKVENSLRKLL